MIKVYWYAIALSLLSYILSFGGGDNGWIRFVWNRREYY